MDLEAERQTLLELLEHTQNLLKSTQDAAVRDQQNHAEEMRQVELRLGSQLRLLKEENKSLKSELQATQGADTVSLKSTMLREIQSSERRGKEKETELLGLIESHKQETQTVRFLLESKLKSATEDLNRLTKDLEAAKQETKRVLLHCNSQILQGKEELNSAQLQVKRANEEISSLKSDLKTKIEEYEMKLKEITESNEKEKGSILNQLKKTQKTLNEKEKMILDLQNFKEIDRKSDLIRLKSQIETLTSDKLSLKQQLSLSTSLFTKKEKLLLEQVEAWKRLNEQMKNRTGGVLMREETVEKVKMTVEMMTEKQKSLEICLENVQFQSEKVSKLLDFDYENSPKMDLNFEFRGENPELKLEEMTKRLELTCKAYETAARELTVKAVQAIEPVHSSFLQQMKTSEVVLNEIMTLQKEIYQLKTEKMTEIRKYQSGKELELTEELVKLRLQSEQMEKSNTSYLESIQELEELIENSQIDGEISPDVELELQRFNLEVDRLTKENATLSDIKHKSELEFAQLLEGFKRNNHFLRTENEHLQKEIESERKRNSGILVSLQEQVETAKRTVDEAKAVIIAEIQLVKDTLPDMNRLTEAWSAFNDSVLTSLREEIEGKNRVIGSIKETWEAEIRNWEKLRALGQGLEAQRQDLTGLIRNLHGLKDTLEELVQCVSDAQGKNPRFLVLETELRTTKATLLAKQAEYEEELALLREQIESDGRNSREMQSMLTTEIASLRTRMRDMYSKTASR